MFSRPVRSGLRGQGYHGQWGGGGVSGSKVADRGFQRVTATRLVIHAALFIGLWGVLAGGQDWLPGILFGLAAAGASCVLLPATRWSLSGIARFLPYFAWQSLRGGIDVAWRAVRPELPIDPGLVRHTLSLDGRVAKVFMANIVTLLPGTLSAELEDHVLVVHVLNMEGWRSAALADLEVRVAMLFNSPMEG